ncbi:hypothetical protein BC937DRAFT_87790 [Endogone sp. FLAS-F59071]|nr:hypothetical protein BC937DRAFT_87790 [Endogone sp. FLAS-F59071]|eukprot:RUS19234.1 hypothetical protein BC937DRAFT_87790 [Endogone sp. FLAS-F59071]
MKLENIRDELLAIVGEYEYGIAPGSTRVCSIDETRGTGQVELELLEGAVVVVEVSDRGFQIISAKPAVPPGHNKSSVLSVDSPSWDGVQAVVGHPFETMESLLMAASPKFRGNFQGQLFAKLVELKRDGDNDKEEEEEEDVMV